MKRTFFTLVLLMFAVSVFGQQENKRGPYLTNGFWDNWFISVGGGVNLYFSEYDNKMELQERLSPALDLSVGKWITPSLGVRLQYAGIRAKGKLYYYPGDNAFISSDAPINQDGYLVEKFNVMNLHGDVLWNISNSIGGYRSDRTWDFVPFAGFGWARASNVKDWNPAKKVNNELGLTVGLLNKIRLSSALDLNVEFRHLIVNESFDGISRGSRWEGMSTASVGLSYKFPRRDFERYVKVEPADYTPYNNRIASLEKQLAEKDANARRIADELAAEKARKAQVVQPEPEYIISPLAVFFQIGKADLTDKEIINLGYAADIIKKSGKKFKIQGSADKATGTSRFNQVLSERRASKVYDILVNKFGVSPSQLEVIAKGDKDEPFGKPVLNRVVIVEN
jgi:outer membrane protein OmpA-like peptidoglycan-associated protein